MYCNAFATQIVDSQHATNDIATKVVKHQDLPYWLALVVEQGVELMLACTRL